MTSTSGAVLTTTFTYDANGNQTAGAGLGIAYTSYNKPSSLTRGTATLSFAHDPEHQRYMQTSSAGTLLYLNDAVTGVSAERFAGTGGAVQWTNYLFAGGERIGMRVERDGDDRSNRESKVGSYSHVRPIEIPNHAAWSGRRRCPGGALSNQSNDLRTVSI